MTASKQTMADKNQDQRDTITRMEVTQNEVLLPAIKRVEDAVTGLVNKDFMTRVEADAKYVTKSDFRPYAVALGLIATIAVGTIVTVVVKGWFK